MLAAVASVITFVFQHRGGAVRGLSRFPLLAEIGEHSTCVRGLRRQDGPDPWAWAFSIPTQGSSLPVAVITAAIALLVVSILVLRFARSYPFLPVGWFWFLGMLVPVIGLVQVGDQALADRYTYVPLVGLFIIVVWASDLGARIRHGRAALLSAATIILVALTVMSRTQVGYWTNSLSLWRHTAAVTGPNARAHTNIANGIGGQGDIKGAIREYEEALKVDSTFQDAHANLAWYSTRTAGPMKPSHIMPRPFG